MKGGRRERKEERKEEGLANMTMQKMYQIITDQATLEGHTSIRMPFASSLFSSPFLLHIFSCSVLYLSLSFLIIGQRVELKSLLIFLMAF